MPFPNPATQFAAGTSGNPGGRPARPLTDRAAAALGMTSLNGVELPGGVTVADLITLAWIKDAMKGDRHARRELLDRVEGKLAPRVDRRETEGVTVEDVVRAMQEAGIEHDDEPHGVDPG